MLPFDVARCAGFLGGGPERCTRRFTCARFIEPAGPNTPFTMSACGAGVDAYIHADTVPAESPAAYPANNTPPGVLCSQPAAQEGR